MMETVAVINIVLNPYPVYNQNPMCMCDKKNISACITVSFLKSTKTIALFIKIVATTISLHG